MKILFRLSILALLLCAAGHGFAQGSSDKKSSKVSVKYDKGKDATTARLKPFALKRLPSVTDKATNITEHQMDLEIIFQFKGQGKGTVKDEVEFRFHCTAANYVFLRGFPVTAVLDRNASGEDRAIALGDTDYKSEPPKFNTLYEEFLTVRVPAEALSKIGRANSLEIFLGPVGYSITESQLAAIKELAGYGPDPAT